MPDIAFTTFSGRVKQLETNFRFEMMREFFDPCFSEFSDLDRRYATMKEQGVERIISAAGVERNFGFRPRRFAGGPGLPPGRYFTLCDAGDYNDHGTLRDEITAYYSQSSGLIPLIFDPLSEPYIVEHLRKSGALSEADLAYPFYYITYTIKQRNERNDALFTRDMPFEIGKGAGITYGVRQFEVQVDRVIDLRRPETQQWFVDTFVSLELSNEQRAAEETNIQFMKKRQLRSFGELLQAIVGLETGGGRMFSQAIGHWLRGHGCNGVIFPSARSNSFCKVVNGEPQEWGGWNLVLYVGAEKPVDSNLFGHMSTWYDKDHDHIRIDHIAEGSESGSFSIRGVREFSLLNFDLKKQIASGVREYNPVGDIVGLKNEALSRHVNRILDQEQGQGAIWYRDVDYIDFVMFHEKLWQKE